MVKNNAKTYDGKIHPAPVRAQFLSNDFLSVGRLKQNLSKLWLEASVGHWLLLKS